MAKPEKKQVFLPSPQNVFHLVFQDNSLTTKDVQNVVSNDIFNRKSHSKQHYSGTFVVTKYKFLAIF